MRSLKEKAPAMQLLRDKVLRETYMCSKLCNMIRRGDLRKDHPQQRRAGQWAKADRDNFIITVLLNEDFDPIKLCEQLTDHGVTLWLIDGLQRTSTIENFKAGSFALGKKINPSVITYQVAELDEDGNTKKDENGDVIYKNMTFDLVGKGYKDLPDKLKENFDNCPVQVVKHLDCNDSEVSRHIVRYNSGKPMGVAQKLVTYLDQIAKNVKILSGHPFFNDCANFSATADKNSAIDKIVCEALMGINFFDKWTKDVTIMGNFLNENTTKEMFDDFNEQLNRLTQVITPETGKLFSQKNALLWFMLFDKFSKSGLDDQEFCRFLNNFNEWKKIKVKVSRGYELVKGSKEYIDVLSFAELNSCSSTKDKGILTDKLHILECVMNDFLHITEQKDETDNQKLKENQAEKTQETETQEIENDNTNDQSTVSVHSIEPENEQQPSILDFVKENVSKDVTDEDVDCYYSMLDEYKVDRHSPLLDWQNEPSLIALIAFSFVSDIDLDQWIVDYFGRNDTYLQDQKRNYQLMKQDLANYIRQKEIA